VTLSHIGIVGAGILGCLSALYASSAGCRVTIIDRERAPWSGASASNEGKIHLGHVYALADGETRSLMLRGALSFADLVDEAVGVPVDWDALSTAPFSYVVMPGSLLDPSELATRYALLQRDFFDLKPQIGSRYLGTALTDLTEPSARPHEQSGLPAFATAERAIDPRALGRVVTAAMAADPRIEIVTQAHVTAVTTDETSAVIHYRDAGDEMHTLHVDLAVNASWEGQQALRPIGARRNYRAKAAVVVPTPLDGPPLTLVQGPFGDVVPYTDRTYLSWYPLGRLSHELSDSVAPASRAALEAARGDDALASSQVAELVRTGVIPAIDSSGAEVVGGFVIGDGPLDIQHIGSALHRRGDFGTDVEGRVLTPRNYKLTTAPLAARATADILERMLA
jgi:glycine/D-amino acid oxidase-like deaminating enzyme